MKLRIFASTIFFALAGCLLAFFLSLNFQFTNTNEDLKRSISVYANIYSENMISSDETADDIASKIGGEFSILDLTGKIIATSGENFDENFYQSSSLVDGAIKNKSHLSQDSNIHKTTISYSKLIGENIIVLSIDSPSLSNMIIDSLAELFLMIFLVTLACIFYAYISLRYFFKSINELSKDFSSNISNLSKFSEFKPLIYLFNKKNKELEESIAFAQLEANLLKESESSKNEFIANITHEMNTPLTSIRGFAELLESDNLNEEMKDKAYSVILTQGEKLSSLIANIINYNEINNDELPSYEVNISSVAKEVIESLLPIIEGKNITLEVDIDNDVIMLTRLERIQEIFGNLITNATKYNKPNGSIKVTVKGGMNAYIQVSDTGIGIAEENLTKVFSRFYTVDKSHNGKKGGFGLGLAVVKKLCSKAGWKISVESELTKGTTFKIVF